MAQIKLDGCLILFKIGGQLRPNAAMPPGGLLPTMEQRHANAQSLIFRGHRNR